MDISRIHCSGCGSAMTIRKMHCADCNVSVEGDFEASSLGQLSTEDQVFVTAFLRSHGSIKKMEALFEISYPTVKNKLNRIVSELDKTLAAPSANTKILDRLARGELTVDEALKELS